MEQKIDVFELATSEAAVVPKVWVLASPGWLMSQRRQMNQKAHFSHIKKKGRNQCTKHTPLMDLREVIARKSYPQLCFGEPDSHIQTCNQSLLVESTVSHVEEILQR